MLLFDGIYHNIPYKVVYSLLFVSEVMPTPRIFSLVFTTHSGVVVRTLITPEIDIDMNILFIYSFHKNLRAHLNFIIIRRNTFLSFKLFCEIE